MNTVIPRRFIDAIVGNDDFIEMLSKDLMLYELLCGECAPKDFLRQQIKETYVKHKNKTRAIADAIRAKDLDEWAKED